jgi:FkbM family methyltransferase
VKKIFLDLGCNRLQGLHDHFKDKLNLDESWAIKCFEANSTVYQEAINSVECIQHPNHMFSKFPDFKIINAAISDKNGIEKIKNIVEYTVEKEIRKGDAGGSTLLDNVVWHQKDVKFEISKIPSIDINTLIEELIQEYGDEIEISVKCDIEGYEYKVIRKLCASQFINKIKQIYIEWHPHFFTNEKDKKAEAFDLIHGLYSKGLQEVFMHY